MQEAVNSPGVNRGCMGRLRTIWSAERAAATCASVSSAQRVRRPRGIEIHSAPGAARRRRALWPRAGVAAGAAALASDARRSARPRRCQYSAPRQSLSDSDVADAGPGAGRPPGAAMRAASARHGQLSDPLARKIALWALVETSPDGMSYAELDGARRDLAGWPGAAGRQSATEKVLEGGGPAAPGGDRLVRRRRSHHRRRAPWRWPRPTRPPASTADAAEVIRHIWRTSRSTPASQQPMLTRFGADADRRRPRRAARTCCSTARRATARAALLPLAAARPAGAGRRRGWRCARRGADARSARCPPRCATRPASPTSGAARRSGAATTPAPWR